MLLLAIKQLMQDKLKSILTIIALASVIAVIFILEGFEQGQYHQLKQLVLNRNADLIATQTGVKNFIATRSVIPQLARAEVESVTGVVEAHPITALPIIYEKDGRRTPIYVIVYDSLGGPSHLLSGRSEQFGANIVIDMALATKYQLKVGDALIVSDFEFTITGITREAAFMMPFAFINYDGMLDLFLESDIAPDLSTFPLLSYLLIDVAPEFSKEHVAIQIEETVANVDVYSTETVAENDEDLGETFFRPIVGVLVSIGYIIGLLVISLIMYSEINNNYKNYAVLKALGFSFGQLVSSVFFLSILLLLLAIPVALIFASLIAALIEMLAPVYLIKYFAMEVVLQTVVASAVFSLLGSLIPLVSVKHADPMMAFQSS